MAGLSGSLERRPEFNGGLLPVVVQSVDDDAVLMLGWANEQALAATLESGEAHFWSRSRGELWRKGATSGNVMHVAEVALDCDADALLYRVRPAGPACHTGSPTCFARDTGPGRLSLGRLERIVADRATADIADSYTARLLSGGSQPAAAKVTEEATELSAAALHETDERVAEEAADVLYHLLVLLRSRDVPLADVEARLAARHAARAAR